MDSQKHTPIDSTERDTIDGQYSSSSFSNQQTQPASGEINIEFHPENFKRSLTSLTRSLEFLNWRNHAEHETWTMEEGGRAGEFKSQPENISILKWQAKKSRARPTFQRYISFLFAVNSTNYDFFIQCCCEKKAQLVLKLMNVSSADSIFHCYCCTSLANNKIWNPQRRAQLRFSFRLYWYFQSVFGLQPVAHFISFDLRGLHFCTRMK